MSGQIGSQIVCRSVVVGRGDCFVAAIVSVGSCSPLFFCLCKIVVAIGSYNRLIRLIRFTRLARPDRSWRCPFGSLSAATVPNPQLDVAPHTLSFFLCIGPIGVWVAHQSGSCATMPLILPH